MERLWQYRTTKIPAESSISRIRAKANQMGVT